MGNKEESKRHLGFEDFDILSEILESKIDKHHNFIALNIVDFALFLYRNGLKFYNLEISKDEIVFKINSPNILAAFVEIDKEIKDV